MDLKARQTQPHIRRSMGIRWANWLAGLLLGGLMMTISGPGVRAVDPLPDHLEKADPELQRVYIETEAKESLRRKLAAGKKRHRERMQYKSNLTAQLTQLAAKRRQVIEGTAGISPQISSREGQSDQRSWEVLGFGFLVLGFLAFYVNFKKRQVA